MRLSIIIFLLFIIPAIAVGQITLDRQVISCFAFNVSDDTSFFSSAGQVAYTTMSAEGAILTQGFEQPGDVSVITLQYTITHDLCNDLYQFTILGFGGCTDTSGMAVLWNGQPGNADQSGLTNPSTLTITTNSGCAFESALDFTELPVTEIACEVVFYSYLSPNGDGDNDQWVIDNLDALDGGIDVKIFNRWGALVWSGVNYDNLQTIWNGTNDAGDPLPDGTYFYMAESGGRKFSGYVEVMR